MHVEIDVFSGQPNPSWELSATQVAELVGRVNSLRAASPRSHPDAQRLGYRGVEVTSQSTGHGFTRLLVEGSSVVVVRGPGTEHLTGVGRGLERWLLATGEDYVDPATLRSIREEMDTMALDEARTATAELFRAHELEDETALITEELLRESDSASDELDGDAEVDDAGTEIWTVNGHSLLRYRGYIYYSYECTTQRRSVPENRVFRIEHIGFCRVPNRKYKLFVR